MRWHNSRSRRSRNLQPENACKGSLTKKDEGAAHSIPFRPRRSLLHQRPDTSAQTFYIAGFMERRGNWPWFADFLGTVFLGNSWPPMPATLDVADSLQRHGRTAEAVHFSGE